MTEKGRESKKLLYVILVAVLIIALAAGIHHVMKSGADTPDSTVSMHLERSDWSDDVKKSLNDLVDMYGTGGKNPADRPYAVFDFDNTCSIFDMEEQTVIYQLQTMAFAIEPDRIKEILMTDLPDAEADLSSYGYFSGSFDDLTDDITADFDRLWDKYGPFTCKGVSDETAAALSEDPYWQDFAARVFVMYEAIGDICSHEVSYPWMTYLFTGMTEDELYDLTSRAFEEYGGKDTS